MKYPYVKYDRLPEHMRDGARDYIEYGLSPGGFLGAVLMDSLSQAFARADVVNRAAMADWAAWLWNDAPMGCWGSPAKVNQWMAERRVEDELALIAKEAREATRG